MQDVTNVTITE